MKYSNVCDEIRLSFKGVKLWQSISSTLPVACNCRSVPVAKLFQVKFFAVCTCGKVPPAGGSVQNLFHFLVKARTVLEYVLNVKLYEYVAFWFGPNMESVTLPRYFVNKLYSS